jgi:hypothetical protein
MFSNVYSINVREYRRGNQKRTIQRNWQHRVHKTKKNKTKTQHNMCWTPLCTNKHKIIRNSERKDIIGQHKKLKRWATRTPPKNRKWTQMLAKFEQFLLLIRHPPCYLYIQSSPVQVLAVIEERIFFVKSRKFIVIWDMNIS